LSRTAAEGSQRIKQLLLTASSEQKLSGLTASLDPQVHKAHKETSGLRDYKAISDLSAQPALKDLRDLPAPTALFQVPKVQKALQAQLDHREMQGHRALQVMMALVSLQAAPLARFLARPATPTSTVPGSTKPLAQVTCSPRTISAN
jgi:hypothetical protein